MTDERKTFDHHFSFIASSGPPGPDRRCRGRRGRPSKSAAEYESEGYTVVYFSDTGYESKGFLVLDKGVTYLKETANGGISRSENRFSLSSGNFKKTSSPDGLDSIYNI